MQNTRNPRKPKVRPRAVGGVAPAEKQPRPVLKTYEDVFRYAALNKRAGIVRRPEPHND